MSAQVIEAWWCECGALVQRGEVLAHKGEPPHVPVPCLIIPNLTRQEWEGMIRGLLEHVKPRTDWACAECAPASDILTPGFQCAYHLALALSRAEGTGR